MKGTYYKTPIDFKALIEKRDLAKTTILWLLELYFYYWLIDRIEYHKYN